MALTTSERLQLIKTYADLNLSHPDTRRRFELAYQLTVNPSTIFNTDAALEIAGPRTSVPYQALADSFYIIRKPATWFKSPRLYRFDRFARALLRLTLDNYAAEQAAKGLK